VPKLGLGDIVESSLSTSNLVCFPKDAKPAANQEHDGEPNADPGSVLIELVERCRRQVAPGLTLSLSVKLGAGTLISSREARAIEFIVCEIVSNAYRYSHPAGSCVEVTLECSINLSGEIVIDIGDDGVGLPPDFAEWRDAGNGIVSVRKELQKVGAALNVTSDDLGLRFQIILHPSARRPKQIPARGNFVWL
jgi:two-component sensor histidine kinase